MSKLTREEIIKQDKISERSFERKAEAAEEQAKFLKAEAVKFRSAARIAREHWNELENER